MSESLKSKTIRGAAWTGFERIANQMVGFVVSIVLARLLVPSDYGVVGMLSVFLSISRLFIDAGFSSALIQKKDRTDADFSTVFWCNLAISSVCYIALFIAAPWIAEFYHMPVLKNLMRVLGLVLVINATYTIQVTRLTTILDFKTQAKVSFTNCVLSGTVGITMASLGFGPWALVSQSIFSSTFSSIAYWFLTKWHPQLLFSRESFKRLFAFGSRILAASCLHTLYTNISPIIIGRKYSAAALGVYSRADSLVALPGGIFQSTLGSVIYPVLSSIQDDEPRLRAAYNKYLRVITSIVAPSMLLMAAVSEPLILTLIGAKWLSCVPYMMILAVGWMIDPIIVVNLNMIYVKGRSDVVLKLEVVKKVIAIAIVVVAVQFGVIWLCVGRTIYSFIALGLNLHVCGPFIGMSFWRQMQEVWRIYMSGIFAALCAYGVVVVSKSLTPQSGVWWHSFVTLAVSGIVGLGIYATLAIVLKFDVVAEGIALFQKARSRICR
jgi:O-antigen/teichoic acid export membrane protein